MEKVMTIELTQGKKTIVDESDYESLSKHKWFLHKDGYASRNGPRVEKRQLIMLHRVVTNAPSNMIVDHINGDKLDNRKSNLRLVTKRENRTNSVRNKNSKSRFKGVYPTQENKKKPWKSVITSNKKQIHLGYYSTEEEAAKAYNEAAIKHFGNYARLNVVGG